MGIVFQKFAVPQFQWDSKIRRLGWIHRTLLSFILSFNWVLLIEFKLNSIKKRSSLEDALRQGRVERYEYDKISSSKCTHVHNINKKKNLPPNLILFFITTQQFTSGCNLDSIEELAYSIIFFFFSFFRWVCSFPEKIPNIKYELVLYL